MGNFSDYYASGQLPPAQVQEKQPQSAKPWWSKLLPAAGGLGGSAAGAAGGAALGTAILPGLGTVAGGIIGSFIGGSGGTAAGRYGQKKIDNERIDSGAIAKEALTSGAIDAATFGLGKVFKAGQLGNEALTAVKAAKSGAPSLASSTVSPEATSAIGKLLRKTGTKAAVKGSSLGSQDLEKIAEAYGVHPSKLKDEQILSALSSNGLIGSGSTTKKIAQIGRNIDDINSQYAGYIKSNPDKRVDIGSIVDSLGMDSPAPTLLQKSNVRGVASELDNQLNNFGSKNGKIGLSQAIDAKRALQADSSSLKRINQSADIPEIASNKILASIREQVPELGVVGKNDQIARYIQDALTKKQLGGITGGVANNLKSGSPLNVGGKIANSQNINDIISGLLLNPSQSKGVVRRGAIYGASALGNESSQPRQVSPDLPQSFSYSGNEIQDGIDQLSAPDQVDQQKILLSRYLQQQILNDLQTTGGKRVANIVAAQKALGLDQSNVDGSGTSYDANQKKAILAARGADNALNTVEKAYKESGGSKGRIGGIFASGAAKIGLNNNVDIYNQITAASVAQIARALGETGVITDKDVVRYQKLLPTQTDNPEVADAKLKILRNRIKQNLVNSRAGYDQ